MGYFRRRTSSADVAADLTAETFVSALGSVDRYRAGQGPAVAWLLGIARHTLLRSARRGGRVEDRARQRLGMQRLEFDDDALERVDRIGLFGADELLGRLPAHEAAAIRARVWRSCPYPPRRRGRLRARPALAAVALCGVLLVVVVALARNPELPGVDERVATPAPTNTATPAVSKPTFEDARRELAQTFVSPGAVNFLLFADGVSEISWATPDGTRRAPCARSRTRCAPDSSSCSHTPTRPRVARPSSSSPHVADPVVLGTDPLDDAVASRLGALGNADVLGPTRVRGNDEADRRSAAGLTLERIDVDPIRAVPALEPVRHTGVSEIAPLRMDARSTSPRRTSCCAHSNGVDLLL